MRLASLIRDDLRVMTRPLGETEELAGQMPLKSEPCISPQIEFAVLT